MKTTIKALAIVATLLLLPTLAMSDEDLIDEDGNAYQVTTNADGTIEVVTPDYRGPAVQRDGAGGGTGWWYTDEDGYDHAIIKSASGAYSHWDAPSPENDGCGCRTPLIPAP